MIACQIEVEQGDTVNIHITNLETSEDTTHGFTVNMFNIDLSLEPGKHENISFTFLGYTFRPREALNKRRGVKFTSFQPAMSREKLTEKSREVRRWRLHRRPNDTLGDLAEAINPIVRGWMTYWGRFYRTEMIPLLRRINTYLMRWARKKYKRLRGFKRLKAWWIRVTQRVPDLFAHWAWTHRFHPTGW